MANPFPEAGVNGWGIVITDAPAAFVQDWIEEVIFGWHETLPDTPVQRHGQADGVGELFEGFAFQFGGMRAPNVRMEHDPAFPKATLTITFDPNPSPDVTHELAYSTSLGPYDYLVTLKDDLHIMDRGPGQPFGGEQLVRDVVAHELGHVIVMYLADTFGQPQTIEALCEIFGASITKWNDTDDPWRERVIEGVCETFKDAILIPTFGRWMNTRDNRTDWQLPEAKWEDWVEWMHKRPKQMYDFDRYDIMGHAAGTPDVDRDMGVEMLGASHASGSDFHYYSIYAEGEITFFEDPVSPAFIGPKPDGSLEIAWDWSFAGPSGGLGSGWDFSGYDYRDDAGWDSYIGWPYVQLCVAFYGEDDDPDGLPSGIDGGLIVASPGDIGFQAVSHYGRTGPGDPPGLLLGKSTLLNENDSELFPPGDPAYFERHMWTADPEHLTSPLREEFRGNEPVGPFDPVYEEIPHNTDIDYHPGSVFEVTIDPPTVTGNLTMKWALLAWMIPVPLFTNPEAISNNVGFGPNWWHNLPRLPWSQTQFDQGSWQKPTWPYAEFPPYFSPGGELTIGPTIQQIRENRRKRRLVESIKREYGWE